MPYHILPPNSTTKLYHKTLPRKTQKKHKRHYRNLFIKLDISPGCSPGCKKKAIEIYIININNNIDIHRAPPDEQVPPSGYRRWLFSKFLNLNPLDFFPPS